MDIREEIKEIYFILSNKKNKSTLGDFGLQAQNEKSDKENIVSPPPAPPLPPEITEVQRKTPDKRKKNNKLQEISTKTTVTMADVLKEMNKVKLKPIQRTPGGKPIRNISRNVSKSNNVSPDLQAILKRRYSAMHNISPTTPDTSMLKRSNSQDSFYDNF
ncbi:mitochondrial fission regulator 2-like [Chrysoperla carnea]|uniref:mitochondrial fission regulator 2-like n=1 Tax=Chrysoperla carnea TaxID=189513 RepID=UPI001D08F7E7|nr:mitochondrial fission regulator 2-like [Chrysoperla carnea]